jgi:hypothetical protein
VLTVPLTIDQIEQAIAREDSELVEAAREVDLSLLRWSLGLTPLERLRSCTRMASTLDRLRRGTIAR